LCPISLSSKPWEGVVMQSIISSTSKVHFAANVATILFGLTIILQLLLAAGILPISMAWGGRQSELTPTLRIASLAAVVLLGIFIYIIRRRAGLIGDLPIPMIIKVLAWIITAFEGLNFLGNLASNSTGEKLLFGPISFILTAACLIVSASKLET
jgi:hypothetical protein